MSEVALERITLLLVSRLKTLWDDISYKPGKQASQFLLSSSQKLKEKKTLSLSHLNSLINISFKSSFNVAFFFHVDSVSLRKELSNGTTTNLCKF